MRGPKTNAQIFADRGDPWDHVERTENPPETGVWHNPDIDQYILATRRVDGTKGSMYCMSVEREQHRTASQAAHKKLASISNRMNLKLLQLKKRGLL